MRRTNLRFADDIVLFGETLEELQDMLEELDREGKNVGLRINTSKTKIMTTEPERDPLKINGEEIDYVEEFVYLGQIISFQDRQDKEISKRIANAWKGYWRLRQLLISKIPIKLKSKLLDMCILPILTYGAATWSLTNKNQARLSKNPKIFGEEDHQKNKNGQDKK